MDIRSAGNTQGIRSNIDDHFSNNVTDCTTAAVQESSRSPRKRRRGKEDVKDKVIHSLEDLAKIMPTAALHCILATSRSFTLTSSARLSDKKWDLLRTSTTRPDAISAGRPQRRLGLEKNETKTIYNFIAPHLKDRFLETIPDGTGHGKQEPLRGRSGSRLHGGDFGAAKFPRAAEFPQRSEQQPQARTDRWRACQDPIERLVEQDL